MSKKLAYIAFILACCAAWVPPTHADDEDVLPGPIPARVLRVVDGDTVAVRARIWLGQDVETMVRLLGIDTPEKRGKCDAERQAAAKATAFVSDRVATDDRITLHDVIADKYGKRVVARILTAKGEDIAALLVRNGLAHSYDGGTKQGWCG